MAEGIVFNVQRFSLHDGPGIRTVVFLKGCPLRCLWCANPESQSPEVQTAKDGAQYGAVMTDEAVWHQVLRDLPFYEESGGGLTLSGGEPLLQVDFAEAILKRAGAAGVHRAVETCGAVPWASVERALPLVDLWLFDVKHPSDEAHRAGTGWGNGQILENLKAILAAGAPVVARIPVIPRFNDGEADARAFAALFADMGVKRADILPFHQMGEKKYETLGMPYRFAGEKAPSAARLERYLSILRAAGIDARA
jgi:pyruvate formate lyase activating enzyme